MLCPHARPSFQNISQPIAFSSVFTGVSVKKESDSLLHSTAPHFEIASDEMRRYPYSRHQSLQDQCQSAYLVLYKKILLFQAPKKSKDQHHTPMGNNSLLKEKSYSTFLRRIT
jgi:hypothetical protein